MRTWILPLLLIGEFALFTYLSGIPIESFAQLIRYFKLYSAQLIPQAAPVLILAMGMTVVLMTAGIDLSVGSMVALVACVMSCFDPSNNFWLTAVPVGLLLAIGLGLFNGALIAKLDVPPIIATLGTLMFYRGLCYVVMGDLEKAPFHEVAGYRWFGQFTGTSIIIGLLFVFGGGFFLKSRWRREILMIGGNRIAARYAGIPVQRRILEVYTLVGFLAFVVAVCFTSRNGSVSGSSLTGLELQVIVAVVLGGTRVDGGYGSIWGAVMGGLVISVLDHGLRTSVGWGQEHLPFKISHLRYILLGGLLVLGVWLQQLQLNRDRFLPIFRKIVHILLPSKSKSMTE